MVDRGAAVVPASIGVGAGFQKDLGALQVPVHHGHVQGRLSLHVHQVHLSPLPDQEVHAVPVACSGRDAQWCAGQPAAAPHRLLVDAAEREHREPGWEGRWETGRPLQLLSGGTLRQGAGGQPSL